MKRMMIVMAMVVVFMVGTANAIEDTDWYARAFKSIENLKILKGKLEANDSMEIRVEICLEIGYGLFLTNPEIVIKRGKNQVYYHLILNIGSEEKNSLLDIVYIYDKDTKEFSGVRIDLLPKNNCIVLPPTAICSDCFMVTSPDGSSPIILFFKNNPFSARVLTKN